MNTGSPAVGRTFASFAVSLIDKELPRESHGANWVQRNES
jgi:hypothetical protein